MKVYIDLQKLAISKVVDGTSPEYAGDINSNVFEILFFNYDNTNWFPTMSQLAPNGREAGDFEADSLGVGETHDYTEDGVNYQRFTFTMGNAWVLMKGRSNLFVWYNVLNGAVLKKCLGKLNVMINESNDNYFISNPVFNPAVKSYIDSVASDIEDELNDKVDAQNATIASLSQASPSVFDTAANIQLLQENKGVAVATDTGYIWYWDTTITPNAYVSSGLQYNSLASYTKHSGNQLKDINNTDFYPNIDFKNLSINGLKIESINGNINLFDYNLKNAGIATIASDGTITETVSAYRFYNRTPIHLRVGDYIEVPNDGIHRFYVYYGVDGVWNTINPWQYGRYTITIEGDYIIMFSTNNDSDDYLTLIKYSAIYYNDNILSNLQNNDASNEIIKEEYYKIRYPKNILNNAKLKIGYKRVWNNPTTLTDDANFVTWDFLEIYETGVYYLSRGNGTAQAPNPAIVWDSEKNYARLFNNGDTLTKGEFISITLGLVVYNAWKDTLILAKSNSAFTYYEAYYEPYYIVKNMLNSLVESIAHQGINVDTTDKYGHNLYSSYENAISLGFNWLECDVVFSSDNVPVLCHDATFTDLDTSTVITIADKTYSELITYNYYGSTIATLDSVLKLCKNNGVGLYIDHMHLADNSTKLNAILSIIDKYRMVENVKFTIGVRSIVQSIQAWDKRARICVPLSSLSAQTQVISLVEEYHNDYNEVGVAVDYTVYTIANIIALNSALPAYAKVVIYPLDSVDLIKQYVPYVTGVTSNALTVNKE